jgi:RNA polymerase sigma-70 factor (ECF subfamily)
MPDISALIERWQAGDERAAEALYNQYQKRVFHLAYGLLGDTAEAEEAAQDALTYALLNIGRYNPKLSKFTTWLHTITVSRCRDRQRRRRPSTFSLTEWLRWGSDQPAPEAGPERQFIQGESRSQVWGAVQALSRPLREAIVLRHWGGHTYQEIADIVGCPVGTAQSRVRLAYQQLAASLAPAELTDFVEEAT